MNSRSALPSRLRHLHGFTLIEILVVLGIVSILASIVILAINPRSQIAKTQNTARLENIRAILDAFSQYSIDANGNFQETSPAPPADCSIPLSPAAGRRLCLSGTTAASCDFGAPNDGNGCVLVTHLVPKYLIDIPTDPKDAVGGNDNLQSDYTVLLIGGGKRMTVAAPNTEIPPASAILSVSR